MNRVILVNSLLKFALVEDCSILNHDFKFESGRIIVLNDEVFENSKIDS